MDRLTKEQRRKNMRAIKSKGSKIEIALAKALWSRGYRYRKHDKTVFGKPDFTFRSKRIAIFVDSEFWHGKDWEHRQNDHKSNKEFWVKKIERNIERDREVNLQLASEGWKVVRFWGKDIASDPNSCVNEIIALFEATTVELKQNEFTNRPAATRKDGNRKGVS